MIRSAVALPLLASVVLTGGLLIAGCGGNGGAPSTGAAPPGGATMPGPGGSAGGGDAATVFASNCAGCHGPDGTKNGHFSRMTSRKDAEIKAMIENGKQPMPGFKGKLSEAQIDALVAHVKTLGG